MPYREYVISHRRKGAQIYEGFDVIAAPSLGSAIETAKARWVKNWNLSFPYKPDGETQVRQMEFGLSQSSGVAT